MLFNDSDHDDMLKLSDKNIGSAFLNTDENYLKIMMVFRTPYER